MFELSQDHVVAGVVGVELSQDHVVAGAVGV